MGLSLLAFRPWILLDLADLLTALAVIQKFDGLLVPHSGVLNFFEVLLLEHVGDYNLIIPVES